MGKAKHDDSDNQMDIQPSQNINNKMQNQQSKLKSLKKNKKIVKNKLSSISPNQNKMKKVLSQKDVIKRVSKLVNLKRKQRPLQQKQQIFKKILKGLHGENASKKQKRRSKKLLKRRLEKALIKQQIAQTKQSTSRMQTQKTFVQRKKKQPLNEKIEVLKIRQNMGQSLSALKSMIANNLK